MDFQDRPEEIDFQKYWLILKRHWLAATGVWLLVIVAATFSAISSTETYKAYGKLRLKRRNTTSALVTEAGEQIGTLDSLSSQDTPLDTEVEVIRSAPIIEKTIAALELTNTEGEPATYEGFLEALSVSALAGTDVLNITYRSQDPQEAQTVVDQLMATYIENNILVNRAQAVAAREFISQQLPKTEAALLQAEVALRQFQEQNNIVDLQTESRLTISQISELNSKINQVNVGISKLSSRINEIETKIGANSDKAIAVNNLNQAEGVQQVLAKLQGVENRLAIERNRFHERNPVIINLLGEKAALEALLEERVTEVSGSETVPNPVLQIGDIEDNLAANLVASEVEYKSLQEEIIALEEAKVAYQQRANAIPQLAQTQRELERQLNAAQSTYEILLERLQQVRIAENQNVGNAQIISPAIASQYPVSTSKKVILAMGIIVGGVFYVVTAFLLELIDPSIKTSKELRGLLDYNLLGMIPHVQNKLALPLPGLKTELAKPESLVRDTPYSIVGEAYRMLHANLRFLSRQRQLRSLVITSSVSQEGKSTVSANLAVASAQLGSQVLLIDADLRHPRQHHIWKLTNEMGLSDVILGNAQLDLATKTVMDNLDILPSGSITPNSLSLLNSEAMANLIAECSQRYDLVIIDTPPLLLVADALTLGNMSDGMLLVARPQIIDNVSANASQELLVKSEQRVLGLVTNGVVVENEPDSYFHYAKRYFKEGSRVQ